MEALVCGHTVAVWELRATVFITVPGGDAFLCAEGSEVWVGQATCYDEAAGLRQTGGQVCLLTAGGHFAMVLSAFPWRHS